MNIGVRAATLFFAIMFATSIVVWVVLLNAFPDDPKMMSRALSAMFLVSVFAAGSVSWWTARRIESEFGNLAKRLNRIGKSSNGTPDVWQAVDQLEKRVSELSTERQTLAALLDGMSEAVLMVDAEERVVLANDLGASVSGLSVGSRVSESSLDDRFADALRNVLWSGAVKVVDLELDDGRFLTVTISAIGDGQDVVGAVILLFDVTELRRLERIRRDFVANLSHEIRTPISVVLSSAETLTLPSMKLEPVAHDFAETILRHSERMSKMVDDLLTLSRLEARGIGMEKRPVSIAEISAEVVKNVAPLVAAKDAKIVVNVGSETAAGDRDAISRIIQNLIENAIKYSDAGDIVELSCEADVDEAMVLITVKDSGLGIDQTHVERIFERFYRVDEGRSREIGGTGLGLAIVKHLVSAMGGEISVTSESGVGSEFVVKLPMDTQHV